MVENDQILCSGEWNYLKIDIKCICTGMYGQFMKFEARLKF